MPKRKPHGGPRVPAPGKKLGAPPKFKDPVRITVWVEGKRKREIEAIARLYGCKVSEIYRHLINAPTSELKLIKESDNE